MNLKKCENGHYYDSDKYTECPRCGSREASPLKKESGSALQKEVLQGITLEQGEPERTVPQPEPSWEADPRPNKIEEPTSKKKITGWLVCIKGELEGTVYELKIGRNTIGGTQAQDIVLAEDDQVARGCQMVVTYDPETRSFVANAGTSRELSYLNGQVVLFNQEMHNRDILQVGGETLLFIPLCGEDFAWDETEE
ncbi:MAG: FHA domain-containing protein [Lachnospiraceae bacterium]|nr:FHA domain-containing protein [Lachnospiraceae bacterium]